MNAENVQRAKRRSYNKYNNKDDNISYGYQNKEKKIIHKFFNEDDVIFKNKESYD
jgi:hypothetical protein